MPQKCVKLSNRQWDAIKREQWQPLVDSGREWMQYCAGFSPTQDQVMTLTFISTGLVALGHYDDAVPVARRCVSLQSDNASCWYIMGEALVQLGDIKGAKIAFRQAVDSGGFDKLSARAVESSKSQLDSLEKQWPDSPEVRAPTEPPARGPSDSLHLSAKEQEAFDWVKCNGVTIGYIPITPAGSPTCPARQFTQLSPKEQEAAMWSRQVAPLCGYALRDDIASITDYRRQDQLTDKEKEAIVFLRKVAPFSGFLLTSDLESTQSADEHTFGTGFFVSSEGHILTNKHVVAECKRLVVRWAIAALFRQ